MPYIWPSLIGECFNPHALRIYNIETYSSFLDKFLGIKIENNHIYYETV